MEAKQNQELWEEGTQNQKRIHANCSKVRMKSDVPLRFEFVLSELWKPNKTSNYSDRSSSLRTHLDPSSQRALDLASAKGASNWLTTRPLQEHGFALHKSAFHDAVALRYGWSPQRTPAHCACGTIGLPFQWSMLYPVPRVAYLLSDTMRSEI